MPPDLGVALAGQRLDQLALAVARDARDADDLAGADLERQILDRELADIVGDRERLDLQHRLARRALVALDDGARLALADHHLGHGVVVELGGRLRADQLAAAQDGDGVAEGIHLPELCVMMTMVRILSWVSFFRVDSTSSASSGVSTEVGSSRISRFRLR